MRVTLQLVVCTDDGREETVTDIVTLQKDAKRIEHLGLTLAESKKLRTIIQQRLLLQQVGCLSGRARALPELQHCSQSQRFLYLYLPHAL